MFVHPSAIVHSTATLAPMVAILAGARVGARAMIGAGSVVSEGVELDDDVVLGAGVRVSNCRIGRGSVLHPGVCVGQDGFGFVLDDAHGRHVKKAQTRAAIIGANVEIGANTCIDRGSWRDTTIADGCKIDNLVQIGHNVVLGEGCVIAAQCGIGGSTELGDAVYVGAQSGVHQHVHIGAGARVAAKSGVLRNVGAGVTVGGYPAVNIRDFHRMTTTLRKLAVQSGRRR